MLSKIIFANCYYYYLTWYNFIYNLYIDKIYLTKKLYSVQQKKLKNSFVGHVY